MKVYSMIRDFNILTIFYMLFVPYVSSFELRGYDSYAKFEKWRPCQNGSLHFEFKTSLLNSMILYSDDGGKVDFLELKLLTGILHLRLGTENKPFRTMLGSNLANNKWHKVFLSLSESDVTLSVDSYTITKSYRTGRFGKHATNSPMYIGGFPYETESSTLSAPQVVFETKFQGSIRNLLYSQCGGPLVRPELLAYNGIVSRKDRCLEEDPCHHGGICITQDNGIYCNCSFTDYEGQLCQTKRQPSEVTFFGGQYLKYDWASMQKPFESTEDVVNLHFRTRQPNGVLLYFGKGHDYLIIFLTNGGVKVMVDLGSGKFEGEISPEDFRFDDNHWHKIEVSRKMRQVEVLVDNTYQTSGTTVGTFTKLAIDIMYVGGIPQSIPLHLEYSMKNFKGCMKEVKYKYGDNVIDMTNLAISRDAVLKVHGEVAFNRCHDIVESQPVTFITPESYVKLPGWEKGHNGGTLSFTFQTNEPNGVIMYSTRKHREDYFGFEILDRHLFLVIDLGSRAKRQKVTPSLVNDGQPHEVTLEHRGRKGRVTFDGMELNYTVEGSSGNLDLEGMLYIGGINYQKEKYKLPKEMWAGMLGYGFVGCMQDLVINGNRMDILTAARKQMISGIGNYCRSAPPLCKPDLCINGGICSEGWNRYICDCRATLYVGHYCQQDAATLEYDGTQYMKITLQEESHTEAEDISLRFRTAHPNGLLFLTSAGRDHDSLALYLESGFVKLKLMVGSGEKTLQIGAGSLDNDEWHTVFIKRRQRQIELSIDNGNPIEGSLRASYELGLNVKRIVLGSPGPMLSDAVPGSRKELDLHTIQLGQMQQDNNMIHRYSSFVGSMQQFIFNGNQFFEMAKNKDIKNIEVTARFDTDEPLLRHPVTFKSKESYVEMQKLNAYLEFSIYFKFKTTEPSGLVMFNAGRGDDFIAFELQGGFLHYVYNTGSGARRVVVNTIQRLNDNKWHNVRLLRPVNDRQTIRIDDQPSTLENMQTTSSHFDLEGHLFIGGVKKTMYNSLPKLISSRHGYQGCMASFDLNGVRPYLLNESIKADRAVVDGCQAPSNNCHKNACKNGGKCVQQWISYTCDCDMTSYTGPYCTEESISYKFEEYGVIEYTLPQINRPNTNSDQLAFGFRTRQRSAILVRIESVTKDDYIEVQLDNGNIFVVYNMGTDDHPVAELTHKHNDNEYHVVRFTRSGPNATLQIDNLKMRSKNPKGDQLKVFNDQARVLIGGYANNTNMYKKYRGDIQGLVFNGVHLLNLAEKKDRTITIHGIVRRNPHPVQSTMTFGETTPQHNDVTYEIITEMIPSGDGCMSDDEDECTGSGTENTEIITPVVTIQPRPKTTTARASPCDENNPDHSCASSVQNPSIHDNQDGMIIGENEMAPTESDNPSHQTPRGDHIHDTTTTTHNIGLIIGIVAVVLVAVIILIIAFYKLHHRDEGTYKVDESQNFAYLEGKKQNGNGTLLGAPPPNSKTGKKKDVKEWYV